MNKHNLLIKITFIIALFCNAVIIKAQSVAINTDGTTAATSALLDVKSTTQGILIPRMTATQRTAIATPATGLMVYQTDATAGFYFYNGTAWTSLNGTNGTNGQGVPTGGTANQVLAKVNGADYNTAWVTPSGGGASLQLVVTKTTGSQILANANGTNTGDLVTFDNIATTPTSGSYSTSTNGYTVATAGLYYVQASTRSVDNVSASNTTSQYLYVDINNGGLNSLTNILPVYIPSSPQNFPSGSKGRGFVGTMLYLNVGDVVTIKGLSANSSIAGTNLKTDGSCLFMVVKLN